MATYTSEIENYPGFPEPIDGIELMKTFDKQFRRFGVDVKLTDVKEVSIECDAKVVSTFRTDYVAKAVILSTGNKPRLTGAKNEERFLNDKGISFCATCAGGTPPRCARATNSFKVLAGTPGLTTSR